MEQGYQNKEIAEKTGIPVGTVGTYAAMFRKECGSASVYEKGARLKMKEWNE